MKIDLLILFKFLDGRFELSDLPEFLKKMRFPYLKDQILKE